MKTSFHNSPLRPGLALSAAFATALLAASPAGFISPAEAARPAPRLRPAGSVLVPHWCREVV